MLAIGSLLAVWTLTVAGGALWGCVRKAALLNLVSMPRAVLLGAVSILLSIPAVSLVAWGEKALAPGDDTAGMFAGGVAVITLLLSPLIGVTAGVAHALVVNARYDRRERRGLCVICGYDLRASSERCPECGTARTGSTAPPAPDPPAEREAP